MVRLLSEEVVQDSSEEENEASTSTDEERSEEGGVAEQGTDGNKSGRTKQTNGVRPEKSASPSKSSDDSGEESDSSASTKRQRETTDETRANSPKRRKRDAVKVPGRPFIAPAGFEPLTGVTENKAVTTAFSELTGKEIWAITAPASLDLTAIKQLDIAAVAQGGPVLTSDGISYGMQPVAEEANLCLPQEGDPVVYKPVNTKVTSSFQLRQIATIPQSSSRSLATEDADTEANTSLEKKQRAVRKQPEGKLTYQHVPFGVKRTASSPGKENVPAIEPTPENKERKKKKRLKEVGV